MASNRNESTIFALSIFDLLVERPLTGLSLKQVQEQLKATTSTTHRALTTLHGAGWVEQKKDETGSKNWIVSKRFLKAAHIHRKAVQSELERVQQEYKSITGEELNHG